MAIENAGRHHIVQRLGSGNFATVFEAEDPALQSHVAIKVLADHHASDPDTRERFVREGRLLRKVTSDRVVAVHDIGQLPDGRPYLVMELADGGTLRDAIGRTETIAHDDVGRVVAELAACMQALHASGLVHRDLKPSNVLVRGENHDGTTLLDPGQRLVLADFGLAREAAASSLTVAAGSDGYMAPEQRRADGAPDQRADLFSASAIVFELLTGRPPRPLLDSAPLTDAELQQLPLRLRTVMAQALNPDPERRYPNARAWGDALCVALGRDPGHLPVAASARSRSRRRLAGIAAASFIVAGLIAAVVAFVQPADGPTIVGPDEISVGVAQLFTVEEQPGARYYWTDWNGERYDAPAFEVIATSPGRLTFTLTEESAEGTSSSTRQIRVVASESLARPESG